MFMSLEALQGDLGVVVATAAWMGLGNCIEATALVGLGTVGVVALTSWGTKGLKIEMNGV